MIWTVDETFSADIELAQFGARDMAGTAVQWELKLPGECTYEKGQFAALDCPTGELTSLGSLSIPLSKMDPPGKLILEVSVPGTEIRNSWDLWVYPAQVTTPQPDEIHMTRELDAQAQAILESGGDVFLQPPPDTVKTDVALGFSSIFWNTAWTKHQEPHTLGILCDPAHPALAEFPSDFHSSWQWWDPLSNAATMELDALPADLRPIVQVVPDWFDPKRLALVFEARVGKGRLLVTSIDLESDLPERPVARQLRTSLLRYMSTKAFNPQVELSSEQVSGLTQVNQ